MSGREELRGPEWIFSAMGARGGERTRAGTTAHVAIEAAAAASAERIGLTETPEQRRISVERDDVRGANVADRHGQEARRRHFTRMRHEHDAVSVANAS